MKKGNEKDDFDRNIWCLLGLVFDAVDLNFARDAVYLSASINRSLFISTPNLNFTIAALDDPSFRETVLDSDLSLIDGVPLLWVSKILGAKLVSKCSGSDLFDKLWWQDPLEGRKVKVFFFGGEEGIAEKACQNINSNDSGLICAGFLNPGFKSVIEISDQATIDEIDESGADLLIVSLGAKKGQAWINRNRMRLRVPVVCHLGAVVNFVAGNVERAPVWMQRVGLEWVWRILQEPSLWSRYFTDGMGFLKLFCTRVLPYALWRTLHKEQLMVTQPLTLLVDELQDQIIVRIKGNCLHHTLAPLRAVFREVSAKGVCIKLDLSETLLIDGAFIGLCVILSQHVKNSNSALRICGLNSTSKRIFQWNCAEYLL